MGLPCSFMDIMTFRPDARSSAIAVWKRGVGDVDNSAPFRSLLFPTEVEIAHYVMKMGETLAVFIFAGVEFDQKDRTSSPRTNFSSVGRNIAMFRANSIMVRSTSSTAIGPVFTRYCAAFIAS